MGYTKSIKAKIFIAKKLSSEESLTDETIIFTQEIEYSVPSEFRYSTAFYLGLKWTHILEVVR